jgi:hypothetical protein
MRRTNLKERVSKFLKTVTRWRLRGRKKRKIRGKKIKKVRV